MKTTKQYQDMNAAGAANWETAQWQHGAERGEVYAYRSTRWTGNTEQEAKQLAADANYDLTLI
jgi:hypothetical protein